MPGFSSIQPHAVWLIGLAAVALYLPTMGHGFVLDDAIVITQNQLVQQGLGGWWDIWTHDSFYGFFGDEGKAQLVAGGRYRPLTIALFAVVHAIVGDTAWIYHLISIVSYGVCCMLVFKLYKRWAPTSLSTLPLMCALLFVVHPVHVESVANIKGMDETLAAILAILALWLTLRPRWSSLHWIGTCTLMWLSLLTKEHTATLIFIAPVIWWMIDEIPSSRRWSAWSALVIGVAIYLAMRLAVIGWPGVTSNELMNNPMLHYSDGVLLPMSWSEQLGTNLSCLLRYMKLLVWPYPLSHDYYPRAVPIQRVVSLTAMLSVFLHMLLVVGSLWLLWLRQRGKPMAIWSHWFAVGALWYVLSMALYTNIFFSVGTHMAERFLFYPTIGATMVVVTLLFKVLGQRLATLGCLLVIGVFTVLSLMRMPVWQDNYTLFTTDVKVTPGSAKLQNAAAGVTIDRYERQDDASKEDTLLHTAISHAEEALRIHPKYNNALLLHGNALLHLRRYDEAIAKYDQLLSRQPKDVDARNNLGVALRRAGRFYGEQQGDLQRSIAYLERATSLDPAHIETLRLLGVAHGIDGNHERAVLYFEQLVEKEPTNTAYVKMLATAYHHLGRTEARDQLMRQIEDIK